MVCTGNAVVLGASMAGLVAARVLSDAYDTVTIIERDTLPDAAAARRGVPQSRQLHVLLAQGRRALDELFEGLSDELIAAGVPLVDLHDQVHWCNDGYPMRRAASDLVGVGISRPLLEATVRAGYGNWRTSASAHPPRRPRCCTPTTAVGSSVCW
ncbi:hypothetical protein NKG94_27245 [Micromonospora sp. M12]